MRVSRCGDDDAVHARGKQRIQRVDRLRPEAFGRLLRLRGHQVGDNQGVHRWQVGQGAGVEAADPAQPDKSKPHRA